MPSGFRLGIVDYEYTKTARSVCFVCRENGLPDAVCQVPQNTLKFRWRRNRGQIEKSLHTSCVTNGAILQYTSERQRKESAAILADMLGRMHNMVGLSEEDRTTLTDAYDVFAAVPGASSSGSQWR